jgi:hypothetical protein
MLRAILGIVGGWIAFLVLGYELGMRVLAWIGPQLGPEFPTFRIALDCCVLAACGYAAVRLPALWRDNLRERSNALWFALTLLPLHFDWSSLDVPWLVRLVFDSFTSTRYVGSLLETMALHGILFACVAIGASSAAPQRAVASVLMPKPEP